MGIDRPKSSPMKEFNALRSGEEGFDQSRDHEDGPELGISKTVSMGMKRVSLRKQKNKSVQKSPVKKKATTEDDYGISALDNTFEIVRKTNLAVKAMAKRNEQVKREMKSMCIVC